MTHTEPTPQESHDQGSFPIVGIGASAGGLAALRTFFENIPANPGAAFVVVVHLSPDHESHLAALLRSSLKIPIQQVRETTKVEVNQAYVIPPDANLESIDTHLRLTPLEERRAERQPIDHFFRSLAQTHTNMAIGVILTGTGSDGTLGLREIRHQGGFAIVQDPADAEYDGMPRSAVVHGMVDLVAPLNMIPGAILSLISTHPRLAPKPDDEDAQNDQEREFLSKIFSRIHSSTGRDFSSYKVSTLLRRISRRMQFNHLEKPDDYLKHLAAHPEEAKVLADDLLIIVTSFFRDRKVFDCFETDVIPAILKGKSDGDRVRVWTAGCATGEEAYSLAILMLEGVEKAGIRVNVQIFASDLHTKSLEKAREGYFAGDIEADVSEERLKRFFLKEREGYRVRNHVRECVVFAPHNLLSDPPFSRLDLISCRNLLIYLQRDLQRKVIELFHYSLNPGGFLVLGTSETVDSAELFRAKNKECSIFGKRNVPAKEPRLPVFPLGAAALRASRSPHEREREPVAYHALYHTLLEQQAPPSLLVDPDDRVCHFSPGIGRYLVHPSGPPTANVGKLIHPTLRLELRVLLAEARKSKDSIRSLPLSLNAEGEKCFVVLTLVPAREVEQEGFVLLVIEDTSMSQTSMSQVVDQAPRNAERKSFGNKPSNADSRETPTSTPNLQLVIDGLYADQAATQRRLETLIEEHEVSQEELRVSNEELQSANEELRSTLEELETSKEELQSMNEELQTVNQENRHRVEELALLSGDLQNLLSATSIATLFLDRELRIQRFTPRTSEMFNFRPTDRGRPISDITHHLGYDGLREDAERVLLDLAPIERVVQDDQGRSYMTRILAYRSQDDRIAGVVITFVEITERVATEHALRISEAKYKALFSSIDEGFVLLEWAERSPELPPDLVIVEANPAFRRQFDGGRVEGSTWRQIFAGEGEDWFESFKVVHEHHPSHRFEYTFKKTERSVEVDLFRPEKSEGGRIGVLLTDITERKRAEQRLRRSEEFHRLAVQAGGVGTWSRESDETSYWISAHMAVLLGLNEPKETSEQPLQLRISEEQWHAAVHPDERALVSETLSQLAQQGRSFAIEFRVIDGKATRWLYATGGVTREGDGGAPGIRGAAIDITARKNSEEALRENETRLGLELAAMTHLHALVARLLNCPDQASALAEVITSTVEVTGATMGCVQTLDPASQRLSVVAAHSLSETITPHLNDERPEEIFQWGDLRNGNRVLWNINSSSDAERQIAEKLGFRSFRASPLMSRSGELLGVLSTFFDHCESPSPRDLWTLDMHARQAADLLDRIEAEVALQQSEAQFRAMFEVSAAAAAEINPSTGEILRINEAFSRMIGFSREESVGRSFMDLVNAADRDSQFDPGIVFNGSGNYQKELRLVRRDGTLVWGLVAANLVAHSSPPRAMVLILDMTFRRDAELSLAEQNRHKDEFIAMLGHELRSPLAAIRNATDLLKLIPHDDRRVVRALKALERQSSQMSRLIDGLLEISRIARGKVTIELETIDLRDVLNAVIEDRESEIEKRELKLIRRLPPRPAWLLADPNRMAQVFDNLLGNAIKFTPGPGTITVSLELEAKHCVVRIIDTGRGMRPEVLGRIFEAFHQDEQDDVQSVGGLGLGLALAKGLLELHDATVSAHSAGPGQGAEFVVRLPLTGPPRSTSRPPPLHAHTPLKILIVEDNQDASEMLSGLLQLHGHHLKVAERAETALELLRSYSPDLIFCDIGLPEMSGLEFCEQFRKNDPQKIFLVALTGYGQVRDREMALAAGFDRHFVKPLDLYKLEEVLAEVSARRRTSH